jgi:SAM-dependent methyltransferase
MRRRIRRAFRRFRELLTVPESIADLSANLHSRDEAIQRQTAQRLDQTLADIEGKLSTLKGELSAQLSFIFHDYAEKLSAQLSTIFHAENSQQDEIKNTVTHINSSIHSRLNTLENETLPALSNQIHELLATQLEVLNITYGDRRARVPRTAERYQPASAYQWADTMKRANQEFPTIFPLWKERLDATAKAFRETKVGNAAWSGDVYSRAFRSLVERYARGRVLDVGCGVFGRPYYLSTYPAELISGIDPLKPEEPIDFECVEGISEYLPWPDGSFSTVVSATSLDHSLSLEQSLAEIRRVLLPEGTFLLWLGSTRGSPKYDPHDPAFSPADQFHLFHFDASWFEPMLLKHFRIVDRYELHKIGYSHVMYCLEEGANNVAPTKLG